MCFLFIIFFVSRFKNQSPATSNQSLVTPTAVILEEDQESRIRNQELVNSALSFTPYEDENFRFDYSAETNKLVVQEKTPEAREKFFEWTNQNGLPELAGNPELVVFENQNNNLTIQQFNNSDQDFDPVIDFLNIFLNFGRGEENSNQNFPTSNLQLPNQTSNLQPPTSGFIYYAQCDSPYADLPLPDGSCNLCQAGCGPSTVAMITASYLGPNFNPQTIVDMYKSRGFLLSCAGSRYSDAKSLLQSLGLKTTDYLVFDYESSDQVVSDFKKYLDAGWTFFTLANFKENGGGHYFWVTEIDDTGNIWAYDPYYGRFEAPPINENSRYPYPKYRLAFGVKK